MTAAKINADADIFLIAMEDKDAYCLDPLATALLDHPVNVHSLRFVNDLSENGGSTLVKFLHSTFPVAVIASVSAIKAMKHIRSPETFLCVGIEHGFAPFKAYTYSRTLLDSDYYLAPTVGWARRLVKMFPERRSKIRLGGYPKIEVMKERLRVECANTCDGGHELVKEAPADAGGRILVILSWGVDELALRKLPDLGFVDYLLHPADRSKISLTCMDEARVFVSSPDISYELISQATAVVGDLSSLTLECLSLGKWVTFLFDRSLYSGTCDVDDLFFNADNDSFGVIPGTGHAVSRAETITADQFRDLLQRCGSNVEEFKKAAPRAQFSADFLPPEGEDNRQRCAGELMDIVNKERRLQALSEADFRPGKLKLDNMRFVANAYQCLLGRGSDVGGLLHYSNLLGESAADPVVAATSICEMLSQSHEAREMKRETLENDSVNEVLSWLRRDTQSGRSRAVRMLDAIQDRILPDVHRSERDAATSNGEKIRWGMKLVSSRSATEDDFVRLAQAYADVESLQDALHWVTKAIELHPAGGELLRFKASILERTGRLEEALQTARAAQAAGADPNAISCDIKRISDHLIHELRGRIKSPDAVQALTSYLGLCRTQGVGRLELLGLVIRLFRLAFHARLDRVRPEIIDRCWKFPEAKPAS